MPDDYEVGYGKPPLHTRFKKGKSGNPSGARRPQQLPGQLFHQLLQETVTVTEQGQRRRMTKFQLVMSQLINKAAAGDPKSLKIFLDVLGRFPPETPAMRLDRDDEKFLQNFLAAAKQIQEEC